MCEIFGAYGWGEGNRLMKWMADFMLVRGVNFFVPHAFSPKSGIDEDNPPHFYTHGDNPQFAGFCRLCQYMERMASLLDGGLRHSCAAVLYHGEGEWGGRCMLTQQPMAVLKKHQINADVLPIDMLASGQLENGELRIGRGRYRALVVPYMEAAPEVLLKQIKRLCDKGFPVVFVDAFPERKSQGGAFSASELDGAQIVPLSKLATHLDELRTIRCCGEEPYLRTYWYHKGDADIWMLFNEHPTHSIKTRIETPLCRPTLRYDAMEDMWYHSDMGNGNAALELAPQEAQVFVFFEDREKMPLASLPDMSECGSCLELTDWEISYQWAGDTEWTTQTPEDLLAFSGVIRYRAKFCLPDHLSHSVLKIENAGETVTGELNGSALPMRLSWPYTWDIGDFVRNGENLIILDVATTLVGQRQDPLSTYMGVTCSRTHGTVRVFFS